jgi:hypothetical protein
MKIIKSDGRHQFYDRGFRIILEFNLGRNVQRERYWVLRSKLEELHGSSVQYESSGDQTPGRWVYNTEWRHAQTSRRGRARLFLRDEVTLSYLLLAETVNTV